MAGVIDPGALDEERMAIREHILKRNRRRQPRCKCGLVATFPEHDYEIDKLRVALGAVMEKRDMYEGNLRVAMASNKRLQHDIGALQTNLNEMKRQRDAAAEKYALLLVSVQPPKKFAKLMEGAKE